MLLRCFYVTNTKTGERWGIDGLDELAKLTGLSVESFPKRMWKYSVDHWVIYDKIPKSK